MQVNMKLEIHKKIEEPLLARNKITATVEFDKAVPSRQDVLKEIASKTGSAPELVVVTNITPSFGSHKANVVAYAYKKAEAITRIVDKKILAKTGFEAPKKEEAPKAEGA